MNPITKYLKNLFATKRVLGGDTGLQGMVRADAILRHLVNDKKVPGMAITVLREGQIVLQRGYGYADLESKIPIDPKKTVFRIASVSKPIAATALAHMVAEGLIDLDASFYTYVPYYPKKKYDFTIRQLASHTAGIRGYKGTEYGLNKPYTIKTGIEIFKDDDLVFQPGTDYLYNSYDWVLVSLAMQEASGVPFEEYVQAKVLDPLGMKATSAESPAGPVEVLSKDAEELRAVQYTEQENLLASFYSKSRSGFRKAIPVNNAFKLAGGGYLSTSDDIATFGQAFLDENVLDKMIIAQFLTSETIGDTPTYYGLGWQVSQDGSGRPFYGHVGNGVGGYSNFFVYPKAQMVFSILINCTNPKVQDQLDEVVDALIHEVENNYLS